MTSLDHVFNSMFFVCIWLRDHYRFESSESSRLPKNILHFVLFFYYYFTE